MKYLKLMRVHHHVKNIIIFLPIIFAGELFNINKIVYMIYAFLAFSFSASFVYIINDIKDKDKDKLHKIKKDRPIASGAVSVKNAIMLAIFLLMISIFFNFLASNNVLSLIYLMLYVGLNILYSFKLKNIVLVDVIILVSGFLIRLLYGATVTDIGISNWLYLTVMSFSFYLGLGKRRNEIRKEGNKTRKVLEYYNQDFLDKNMYMCMTLTIIFYALWCIEPQIASLYPDIIWTVPLVMLIAMKYSLNIESSSYGDPVDVILKDKVLLFLVFIYGIIMFTTIYGAKFIS